MPGRRPGTRGLQPSVVGASRRNGYAFLTELFGSRIDRCGAGKGAAQVMTAGFDVAPAPGSGLLIGDWYADPATHELRRGAEVTRIEPKAMEVLMLLAQHPGRVVRREELFAAVWPGVVVGDEALTQSINKLRRALGDNARSASYIETISKRGYRLIAPVRDTSAGADEAPPKTVPASPARGSRFIGLVIVVLCAVVLAVIYFNRSTPTSPVERADIAEERQDSVTVTVLPFKWLGAAPEQAYLALGIDDALVTELSRLPGLRLVRHSSTPSDAPAKARYVVSGSVQREADTLRINIHLTDGDTRQQLWSERFERRFGELFAVQDEISRKLAQLLPGKLADAAHQRHAKRYTRSLEAYDHFLQGQALFLARRSADNEEARKAYGKALELDPNFARAYASLAMTHAMDYRLRPSPSAAPALARAFELAETARLIYPDIAEVYWALGFVHTQSRRHEQALVALRTAIEINPSFADAYALMAGIHTYIGQPAKAIPLLRNALRLNPDGGYLYFLVLGRAYLLEGDIEQARLNLREASSRNHVDLETRLFSAAAATAAGDRALAQWEAQEIRALEPTFSLQSWLDSYPLAHAPHRQRLVDLLTGIGL
jgi:DNA-binding winged helix-turn-helix (wHTH) protein/TolB-like protein/Tfp pilus assembly protein PilF